MANPRKLTRPFRGPGDVERMWRRLARSGPDWKDASPIDKAAFLQAMSPAYAAYDIFHELTAPELAQNWFAVQPFQNGAALNTDPAGDGLGTPQQGFWFSPVFAENARTPSATPSSEFLSGWYFLPKDITLNFYDPSTWALDEGRITWIRSPNIDSGPDIPPSGNIPERYGIIGGSPYDEITIWQVFSTHPGGATSATGNTVWKVTAGWLRDFPLLANAILIFDKMNSLVAGNIIRIIVTGEWHFSPYYMEPGEEPDR